MEIELKKFINRLIGYGFKVYTPKEPSTYYLFVKDDKIGYVERGNFGFNFCSVHKPNLRCGTGYIIHNEVCGPTIRQAKDCFCYKPFWASEKDVVIKYRNYEDYIKSPTNSIIETVEILETF